MNGFVIIIVAAFVLVSAYVFYGRYLVKKVPARAGTSLPLRLQQFPIK